MQQQDSTIQLQCPTCKKTVLWNDDFPHRPFCSDRCRLIDLGDWANENHRIAGDSSKGIHSAQINSDFSDEND